MEQNLSFAGLSRVSSDLFTSILSYLPDKSIAALITNANLDKAIKESAKTNIFWKQRVETLLGRYLEKNLSFANVSRHIYPNWKIIYNNLIEDFEGNVNLINEQSSLSGSKALIRASENNHPKIVELLLADKRVDPSAEDSSAMKLASMAGYLGIVKLLLDDGRANPSANNNYAIIVASRYDRLEVVKLLLVDSRADPSAEDNSAIKYASMMGNSEVVKLLLDDDRVNPSADNNFAIRWASKNIHTKVVKLLLSDDRGKTKALSAYAVDPSVDNNIVIRQASESGNPELVKLLLADKRVDPSAGDNSAIIQASYRGRSEVVKLLLNYPVDEEGKTTAYTVDPSANNNEAIRSASRNGYSEVVRLLLEDERSNPSANNNEAITQASLNEHYKVVNLLLADGRINIKAKINAVSVITNELRLLPPAPGIKGAGYLAYLDSSDFRWKKPDPVFDIDKIIYLVTLSLRDLIKRGNNSKYDREIILSKFFWWFRLNKLYGITTSEAKDPFIKSLLLERS